LWFRFGIRSNSEAAGVPEQQMFYEHLCLFPVSHIPKNAARIFDDDPKAFVEGAAERVGGQVVPVCRPIWPLI